MAAAGFTNIQITLGNIFETVAVKDGRSISFMVAAMSGGVFERPGADDDDD